MRMKWPCQLTPLLTVALLTLGAVAHAESVIIGTLVSDETKQPAVDVVITAASPSLQGERVVVSDEQGRYRMPALPPGVYTLRFEKDGAFQAFVRSDIQLREGRTVRVNVELLSYEWDEDDIMGCGPLWGPPIDVASAAQGVLVEPDGIERLVVSRPTDPGGAARSFEGIAELAPGVRREAAGLSISGATPFENGTLVDGLYTSDPLTGLNPLPLNVELLQEVNILTGGAMAEYGRSTGGLLVASTRSGSRKLRGSVFANWAPGLLEGARTPVPSDGAGGSAQTALQNLGGFGATLGGPLVKKRLWFFAGVAPVLTRLARTHASAGDSRTVFADQRGTQALGKLTYFINGNHDVTLSLSTTPMRSETLEPAERASNFTTAALHYKAWSSTRRLLLDSHFGWSLQTGSRQSSALNEETRVDRYQARVTATYGLIGLAGQHLLMAGADAELRTSEQPLRSTSHLLGGFVQDSWSFLNRVTLNAGVRYDTWLLDDGRHAAVRSSPLSPRLGVIVDPSTHGSMKFFAHYAEHRAPVLLRAGEGSPAVPDLVLPASRELLAGAEFEVLSSSRLGASYTRRDLGLGSGAALERTYDAATVSLSRQYRDDWQAEVSYTWSRLRGSGLGPWQPNLDAGVPADDGTGRWTYDRPHFLKAFGSRDFRLPLARDVRLSLGLSYRGSSGVPLPGPESGPVERTPWVHAIDSNVRVAWWVAQASEVSAALDVFNLFNAQEVTRMREASADGVVPVEYQGPRQVRLRVRYTF